MVSHRRFRAYALQDEGLNTVDANRALDVADDAWQYSDMVETLVLSGALPQLCLLTNNPMKVRALMDGGYAVHRKPLVTGVNRDNIGYLAVKRNEMGHLLPRSLASPETGIDVAN